MTFPHLQKHTANIKLLKDDTVKQWLVSSELNDIFEKYSMDRVYFKEHHAIKVFEYFHGVFLGTNAVGECPSMTKLVDYLKNRSVTIEDLYIICSTFRNVFITLLLKQEYASPELISELQIVADRNFIAVIKYFNKSIFSQKEDTSVEEQLQIFHEYQKVIDKSAIVSKTDTRGFITYVNAAFMAISGYTRDELIGKPHNIIRHPDMKASVFKSMWKTIQAKKIFKGTVKNRKRNGDSYYVDTTIFPILDRDNNVVEYIAMRYDVTKFVHAVTAAKAAKKAKDNFLSNMSHEIRTPLNAILGFVHVLQKSTSNPKQLEQLQIIHKSGESLLHIINDILDFAKIESGQFKIDLHEFHPIEEFTILLKLFSAKMQEKNISLIQNIDPDMSQSLIGDVFRIKQIVSNLLSNAIKFTPSNGTIEVDISFDVKKTALTFMVKDSGIGIEQKNLKNIFNSFEQADNSTSRKYGGTGLGLSISKNLVELMQGKLHVKSTFGKGATFSFIIPVEVSKTLQPQLKNSSNEKQNRLNFMGQKVLVAEDNRANQQLLEIYLAEYNIDVSFANNGEEALLLFKENSYAFIFMDSQMPIMNGIEATQAIINYEKEKGLVHTPIIALTANVLDEDKKHFKDAGMDSFLSKPINTKNLAKTLQQYLGLKIKVQDNTDMNTQNSTLDINVLANKINLNAKHIPMLLQSFKEESSKLIKELRVAIHNNNYEQISYFAHTIKGSSANLHFTELSDIAKVIEDAALEVNTSFNYMESLTLLHHKLRDINKNII